MVLTCSLILTIAISNWLAMGSVSSGNVPVACSNCKRREKNVSDQVNAIVVPQANCYQSRSKLLSFLVQTFKANWLGKPLKIYGTIHTWTRKTLSGKSDKDLFQSKISFFHVQRCLSRITQNRRWWYFITIGYLCAMVLLWYVLVRETSANLGGCNRIIGIQS